MNIVSTYSVTMLLVALVGLSGCDDRSNFIGSYADTEGGSGIAKLEKRDSGYALSIKWYGQFNMREATEMELRTLLTSDYTNLHPVGFCGENGGFPLLVRVDKDIAITGHKFNSSTLLITGLGMSWDLYKQ